MSDELRKRLHVTRATAMDIREVLALLSMGSDLRLYKWREWIGGELTAAQLAEALDEWVHHMSRYGLQLAQLTDKLREANTAPPTSSSSSEPHTPQ